MIISYNNHLAGALTYGMSGNQIPGFQPGMMLSRRTG
jgi:hypothetical protein